MAQTYRDNMINVQDGLAIVRATRSKIFTGLRSDYTEKMRFPPKPGHGYTDYGWWSGFLSSRDAQTGNKDEQNKEIGCYYPLYSRIEIKLRYLSVSGHGWHYGCGIIQGLVRLKLTYKSSS